MVGEHLPSNICNRMLMPSVMLALLVPDRKVFVSRPGVSDIIARISYLVFSHYLTNIVYRDINGISRYLYDI